ncbi:MAG: imidazolonepropionase-like amidohydrolase [Crocinitomicaceae bacterium]|jgi:imidazolonepropionase-like amidohydrolase
MKVAIQLFIFVFLAGSASSQESKNILLTGGFLHIGNGEIIKTATVGIRDGIITLVQNSLTVEINRAHWDTIIDVSGKHIYPGFIAPNSTLGLGEVDAVRATIDFEEVGIYNPHVRSQIAFNVESKVVSTVRTNGVLLSQATPRGGTISGTSSIMALDGWNWEDATISVDDGIHLNWPRSMQGGGWWAEPSPKKTNEKYAGRKQEIYAFFEMALAYAQIAKPEVKDLRLEAMRECFNGTKRVYIHADELQELVDVIEFSRLLKLPFPVIVGGYDSHLITRQLKDADIPVMIIRPHSLPENEEDDINHPYRLASLLNDGGVRFCIQNHGDMERMNARNLPFQAGTSMAYGLSPEDAVKAISLSPAEIMGIGKSYGSIEKGKSATLFVSDGDALDIRSNNMFLGMINGVFISNSNFQKDLYEKYSSKYKADSSR